MQLVKESLNLGDVFILDKGTDVYVWMPPESGRLERMKVGLRLIKNLVLILNMRYCIVSNLHEEILK